MTNCCCYPPCMGHMECDNRLVFYKETQQKNPWAAPSIDLSVELPSCLKLNKGHDKNREWYASALFIMKPLSPEGMRGGGTQQGSKVQPLALLYNIFDRKGPLFIHLLLTNGTPVTYSFRTLHLFSCCKCVLF